jgi:hypothetical protein
MTHVVLDPILPPAARGQADPSIVVPTVAQAQSCLDVEALCTSTEQCCGPVCGSIGGCDRGPTVGNPAPHCRSLG